jgi:peroxisomal enoyl-CoA hydratase 2
MNRNETYFEDVQEGDQAPEWGLAEPLERQHFVRYAGASGDFNPLHYDDGFATKVGFPSVIAQGMFTAGVLSHYVSDWLGLQNIRKYVVKFKDPVFPEKKLTFKATVSRKYKEGDENLVDCDLEVVTNDGNTVIAGSCTAALPSRG